MSSSSEHLNPIAEAAIAYARMGWAIVPLKGKRPRVPNWPNVATTDERQILTWAAKWPDLNIGLATGDASGFFVVDVDGPEGEASLRELELRYSPLPETLEGHTGGGGRHLLFRQPTGLRLTNRKKPLGVSKVDIRGTGGQIVAPPSIHPETGAIYEWASDPATTPIADAPSWLVELLTREDEPEPVPPAPSGPAVIDLNDERARKFGLSALAGEERNVLDAQEGERNNTLNRAALKLGARAAECGLSEAMVEAVLVAAAMKIGLSRDEATATFRSGWRAGLRKPKPVPAPRERELPARPSKPQASAVPVPVADDLEAELIDEYEGRLEEEEEEEAEYESRYGSGGGDGGTGDEPAHVITVEGGELDVIVDMAEAALINSGAQVYRLGGQLVRPVRETRVTIKSGVTRKDHTLLLMPVTEPWLLEAFTKAARWRKWDARSKDYRWIDCPAIVPRIYLAREGQWRVPPIRGVIEAPTLRPDGSVLEQRGYDESTALLLEPGNISFDAIPQTPTREDALAALARLKDLVKGFPFDQPHDCSIAIAAMLTALVRRSIQTAPLFAFNAPKMGSGKSLLADCVSLLATGREAPMMTPASNKEEEAKSLFAVMIQGDPVIVIDNVSAPLESDLLCTLLTSQMYQNRILGSTKNVTVPTCSTWMATGNNLVFVGDLTTRVLRCDLDAGIERPEERTFDVNLKDYIPEHRHELVPAALTILRAYVVAGRPKQNVPQMGRFESWSDWVRAALLWLGEADPCLSRLDLEAADTARTQLVSVLSAWYDAFVDQRMTVAQVVGFAKSAGYERLQVSLLEVAATGGEVNSRRLGKWLKKFEKRIEGGFRLEQDGLREGNALWKVLKVSGGFGGNGGFSSTQHEKVSERENEKSHERGLTNTPKAPNPPSDPSLFDGNPIEDGDA